MDRAFVRLRHTIITHKELAAKLSELERKVVSHDGHIKSIFDAIDFPPLVTPGPTWVSFLSYYWIAESRHFPSWIRMKVQASPDSVGISSLPSTR